MGRCPLTALSGLRLGGGLVFKGWLGFRVKDLGSLGSRVWGFMVRGCRLKGLGLSCLKLCSRCSLSGLTEANIQTLSGATKIGQRKGPPKKILHKPTRPF